MKVYAYEDLRVVVRKRPCEECAVGEIRLASECSDREEAAKVEGRMYHCTCPRVVCSHVGDDL